VDSFLRQNITVYCLERTIIGRILISCSVGMDPFRLFRGKWEIRWHFRKLGSKSLCNVWFWKEHEVENKSVRNVKRVRIRMKHRMWLKGIRRVIRGQNSQFLQHEPILNSVIQASHVQNLLDPKTEAARGRGGSRCQTQFYQIWNIIWIWEIWLFKA
jgi:hypothetical protein